MNQVPVLEYLLHCRYAKYCRLIYGKFSKIINAKRLSVILFIQSFGIYGVFMDIKGLMGGLKKASRALFANYMNIYNALIYMARKG